MDLKSTYPSLREAGIPGDFHFTIIHRVFSPSSNCSAYEQLVMSFYERLRRLGVSADTALGLDTSSITIEQVPLILNSGAPPRAIRRVR